MHDLMAQTHDLVPRIDFTCDLLEADHLWRRFTSFIVLYFLEYKEVSQLPLSLQFSTRDFGVQEISPKDPKWANNYFLGCEVI